LSLRITLLKLNYSLGIGYPHFEAIVGADYEIKDVKELLGIV